MTNTHIDDPVKKTREPDHTLLTAEILKALGPKVQSYMRQLYTGNQCDTDEYRETQPANGIGLLEATAELVGDYAEEHQYNYQDPQVMNDLAQVITDYEDILATSRIWLMAWKKDFRTDGYAGSDDAIHFHNRAYNLFWKLGYSLDHDSLEDLAQLWNEDVEDHKRDKANGKHDGTHNWVIYPELEGASLITIHPITRVKLKGV